MLRDKYDSQSYSLDQLVDPQDINTKSIPMKTHIGMIEVNNF